MPSKSSPPTTPEKLLDTAERLFAQRGFPAVSLREITREAGANVAAVHYHFGSKEGLLREVFVRRLAPLNRRRLERLDLVLSKQPTRPPLNGVLEAFIAPVVEMRWGPGADEGHRAFARLMGRLLSDPHEGIRPLMAEEFRQVFERFVEALARAVPDLAPRELLFRFQFTVGAMAHCVVTHRLMDLLAPEMRDLGDPETLTRRLVEFTSAGFRAAAGKGSP